MSPAAITPSDGPVAVTGASGYIGSWIVKDCLDAGYTVRACVRDASIAEKVDHLHAMNNGNLSLYEADLFKQGSYDDAFADCAAVIHAGASVGYNKETPQQVYDGCFTENEHVIGSVEKSGSVKRFVFTSSFAAVGHPRPQGYVFTEKDWCGDNIEAYNGKWTTDRIPENRDLAYAMAKANTERMIYQASEAHGGYESIAILPLHVIGPLIATTHDQGWSWQNCLKFMMQGKPYAKSPGGRMLWNMVDVRDVARAHRLAMETTIGRNGSRYVLAATDRSGEMFTWELQAKMKEMFPGVEVGGEEMDGDQPVKATYDSPRAYCTLAREELGLETHDVEDTIRSTISSYKELGLL